MTTRSKIMKAPLIAQIPRERRKKRALFFGRPKKIMPRQMIRLRTIEMTTAVIKFLKRNSFVDVLRAAKKRSPVQIARAAIAVNTDPGVRSAAIQATSEACPRVQMRRRM